MALYQQVADALVEDFTLGGADDDRKYRIFARAMDGLQSSARALTGAGEVVLPRGFEDRATLGPLLFLRPLLTAGRLTM